MTDVIVFCVSALIILAGGVGVIANSNPVKAALSLVATFFGVAVLFVLLEAQFLALVQVVVYGGAIVVLFLFVIMLLGVDESENLKAEPLAMQRVLAVLVAFGTLALLLAGLFLSGPGGDDGAVALTGSAGQIESLNGVDPESELASVLPEAEAEQSNITRLARDLFTRNVLALEATALLLTIATIGAVVMVKNQNQPTQTVTEGQN